MGPGSNSDTFYICTIRDTPPTPVRIHPGVLQVGACGRLGSEAPPSLPGFGVEAVLKNMEYSAMDDKKVMSAGGHER